MRKYWCEQSRWTSHRRCRHAVFRAPAPQGANGPGGLRAGSREKRDLALGWATVPAPAYRHGILLRLRYLHHGMSGRRCACPVVAIIMVMASPSMGAGLPQRTAEGSKEAKESLLARA
jgi:hypothetical protein